MTEQACAPRFLRLKEVKDRCGLGRSTIYARMKEGTFPSPVSLGARAVGWVEQELDEHLAKLIEQGRKAREIRA
jgi:prophage regulatory protein